MRLLSFQYFLLSRMLFFISVLALTGVTIQAQEDCTRVPSTKTKNRKIIISDLHLGAGLQPDGNWSALEDFRFADVFRRFLEQIGRPGNTDLIIAGDFIDFWQILPELDEKRVAELGPTEQDSLAKLEVAIKQHRKTFLDLSEFTWFRGNRLIIVPGNHDVDLLWPRVRDRLQQQFGLPLGQKLFFTNACYESDGVYVEHGHQYDAANRFRNANAPFATDDNSTRRLETNWGSVFMSRFYNRVELEQPFIDNLAPETAAIVFALQNEFKFSIKHIGRLAVMLFRDQKALAQFNMITQELGTEEPPKKVPEKTLDNLLKLYEGADPELAKILRATVQTEETRQEAENAMKEITPEEWARLQAGFKKVGPTEVLGNKLRGIDPYLQAARQIVVKKPSVNIVVMAHTHELDGEVVFLDKLGLTNRWYVNTGCWQKVLNVQTARARGKQWNQLNLDDPIFQLRFSYVIVNYDGDKPMRPARSFW